MNELRKQAIVIGGAMGIGEAVARRFAADGYAVTIVDRVAARCHALAEELGGEAAGIYSDAADITDAKALAEALAALRRRIGSGGVQAAVNTVGVFDERGPLLKTDAAGFKRMLDVNVTGAFLFSRAVEPLLAAHASLVHIGSVNGITSGRKLGAYKVSKAALHMLARCLASELARDPRRIRVNVVAPGWVDTPGERRALRLEGREKELDDPASAHWLPMGRRIETHEIADAVAFLCSEKASAITGQILCVDCGTTM